MSASFLQSWFALPHAGIGALALVSFWTAALARKGSQAHRYAGRVFLLAMLGILITALPLTISTGLGVVAVGIHYGALILIAFGAIGPLAARPSLRLGRRGPSYRQ